MSQPRLTRLTRLLLDLAGSLLEAEAVAVADPLLPVEPALLMLPAVVVETPTSLELYVLFLPL